MWHIILNTENSNYVVLSTEDGIISYCLINDDRNIWTKYLSSLTGTIYDGYPEPLDKWISSDECLKLIFSFESDNPIDFIQSIHITHPELFI